jgi:hypothetical protein
MLARSRPLFTYANVCSTLALVIALSAGSAYAANTIRSGDIVDGQVKRADLAANAVSSTKIADNSVRATDLRGADITGAVSLSGIANGRCSRVELSVSGARAGETALFAPDGAVQNGVVFVASRVPSDGHVTVNVCNLTGTTMTPISDLPVRVMTFG